MAASPKKTLRGKRGTSTTEITPRKVNLNKRRQSGELRRKVVIAANARRMQTRPKASKRFRLTHPKNLHTARSLFLCLSFFLFRSGSNSEPFVRRGMSINFLSIRERVNRRVKWPGEGFKSDGEMGQLALLFADSMRIVSWFSINVWLDSPGEFEFNSPKEESCMGEAQTAIQSSARDCLMIKTFFEIV